MLYKISICKGEGTDLIRSQWKDTFINSLFFIYGLQKSILSLLDYLSCVYLQMNWSQMN